MLRRACECTNRARGIRRSAQGQQSNAIVDAADAALPGTIGAAVHLAGRLDAMADDAASAMNTLRSQLMDRAFEAVEGVAVPPKQHIEALVVVIAADVTLSHLVLLAPCIHRRVRPQQYEARIFQEGLASRAELPSQERTD